MELFSSEAWTGNSTLSDEEKERLTMYARDILSGKRDDICANPIRIHIDGEMKVLGRKVKEKGITYHITPNVMLMTDQNDHRIILNFPEPLDFDPNI